MAAVGSVAKQMTIILNYFSGGAPARVMQGPQQSPRGAA
jgi:hypothetical protein